MTFFDSSREKEEKRQTLTSKQQTLKLVFPFACHPGTRGGSAKRCSFPFSDAAAERAAGDQGGRESRDVGDCACAP